MSCVGKISPLSVRSNSGLNFASGAHLSVEKASWSLPEANQIILHPITFHLPAGKVLGVVGPNGAGKSSLLRLLYRYHVPTTGTVKIDGADINQMSARDAACKVAAVLQEQPIDKNYFCRVLLPQSHRCSTVRHVGRPDIDQQSGGLPD